MLSFFLPTPSVVLMVSRSSESKFRRDSETFVISKMSATSLAQNHGSPITSTARRTSWLSKKKGLLTAVKPKLDLLAKSNLYLSATLRQTVLDMAEE